MCIGFAERGLAQRSLDHNSLPLCESIALLYSTAANPPVGEQSPPFVTERPGNPANTQGRFGKRNTRSGRIIQFTPAYRSAEYAISLFSPDNEGSNCRQRSVYTAGLVE